MPGRLTPLVNDQTYHVFNRGIDHRLTFTNKLQYNRAIIIIDYYRFANLLLKLSKFLKTSNDGKQIIINEIKSKNNKHIEIFAYCLIPNHFHFLVKQLQTNGISKFMANFQNSYTRYFNTQKERTGPLFLDQFKSLRIETDEQFLHVSRYIHLNPLTSYVVKDFEALLKYPWSSLNEYLNNEALICEINAILNFFKQKNDYLDFIEDQIDYQREIHKIQHLLLE